MRYIGTCPQCVRRLLGQNCILADPQKQNFWKEIRVTGWTNLTFLKWRGLLLLKDKTISQNVSLFQFQEGSFSFFSYQNFQKYGPEMDYQWWNGLRSIFTAIEQNSIIESQAWPKSPGSTLYCEGTETRKIGCLAWWNMCSWWQVHSEPSSL